MEDYHEKDAIIKDDEATPETLERETRKQGMTRRKFLRNAALGAAAVGAAYALKGGNNVLAQSSESGQVTVDGILLSYVAAPLGSVASTTNSYTKNHASTFKMIAESNRSLSIGVSATILGFNVGSITYKQTDSTQVTDAITIRRSITESFTTPAPGDINNTVFVGLREPEMQFDGTPSRVRFRFLKATDRFGIKYSDLQLNGGGVIKPATVTSFLSKYVTDPALLVTPRFKLKSSILLSAGVTNTFSFTKATGSTYSTSKTATTSVEITKKFGFSSLGLSFEVGARIEVTHTSVQEFTAENIITSSTVLNRTSLGINKVYWDRVFKTFTIIDAGPPDAATIVQGRITNPTTGLPIARALVRMIAGAEYAALTDNNGNYSIKLPSGENLSSGTYAVVCGDDSVNAFAGSGIPAPSVYLEPGSGATNLVFNGELYNLN